MLGKASEIKTHFIEEIEKKSEFEKFSTEHQNAEILDIKYSVAFNGECIWYTALIIYKEGECKTCFGEGGMTVENFNDPESFECPDCHGTGKPKEGESA